MPTAGKLTLLGMVSPYRVRIRAFRRAPLGEAPEAERFDIDRLRPAIEDQLGHADAHRGRDLEAGAAERGGEIEAVDTVHPPEDRVAVAAVAIEGAIAPRERRAFERRNPVRQDLRADHRGARRQYGGSVGIEVPLLARHAHNRA